MLFQVLRLGLHGVTLGGAVIRKYELLRILYMLTADFKALFFPLEKLIKLREAMGQHKTVSQLSDSVTLDPGLSKPLRSPSPICANVTDRYRCTHMFLTRLVRMQQI
jgi:hypothetical protein